MTKTVEMLVINKYGKPIGKRNITITRDVMCFERVSKGGELELVLVKPHNTENTKIGETED